MRLLGRLPGEHPGWMGPRSLHLLLWLLVCAVGTTACPASPSPDGETASDLPSRDLSVADLGPPDLALGPIQTGALGAACRSEADCTKVAKDPVCFREYLLNSPVLQRTPGGYCSAHCERNADCGPLGRCVDLWLAGRVCMARCNQSGICRAGYACLLGEDICVPAQNFTCDPTENEGRCQAQVEIDPMAPKVPGGCIRQTYENLGRCAPECRIGRASCPIDPVERLPQHCVYLDTTVDRMLRPTRDKWKGLVCMHDPPRAVADGQPCSFFEECFEGSQCDLWPGGSGRCHPLCIQGGMPACPMGTTCQDALRAGPGGPGLCK